MNYAARNATILGRIDQHKAHPAAAELKKAALNCFAVAQNFSNQRDELWQDRFLSADGKRAKLAEMRTAMERLMADARKPIDTALKAAEQQRAAASKPVQLEQTSAAEQRRIEVRQHVRTLPLHEQLGLLMGDKADPEAVEAVLDRKPWLSGIPAAEYAKVLAARDERVQQGPQFRPINALQAVVDEANAAAGVAQNDLASIAADSGAAAA